MFVRLAGLVAAFVLLLCATASAATPFWHTALIATDNDDLQSASCSTPTLCIAVGDNGIAAVEDGSYEYLEIADQDANLPSLNSISCVPGKRFCMAVDSRGQAVPWVDGEWGTLTHVDGNVVMNSVSCPSETFCKAIDDAGKVFTYSNGTWTATSVTLAGSITQGTPRLSCATPQFCVAVAQGSSALNYYKFTDPGGWSAATSTGISSAAAPRSLVCTLATFCLLTTNKGSASRFNGTTWSTATQVVQTVQVPLFAGCAPGTTACQAIDQNVKGYSTTDGVTWSSATDLRGSTQLSVPSSVSCLAVDLCVATSGLLTSAFARSIVPTSKPIVNGTGKLGETLTVTHPPLDETRAWYRTIWWRCQDPGSNCVPATQDSSPTYTVTDVDRGMYIEARDDTGIGLDEEGSKFNPDRNFVSLPLQVENPSASPPPASSQSPGPSVSASPSPSPSAIPAAKFSAAAKASKTAVTVTVKCPGACKGKLKLTVGSKTLASKAYSASSAKQVVVKLTLGKAAKKLLKAHHKLKATLTVDPAVGKTLKLTVTLRS